MMEFELGGFWTTFWDRFGTLDLTRILAVIHAHPRSNPVPFCFWGCMCETIWIQSNDLVPDVHESLSIYAQLLDPTNMRS